MSRHVRRESVQHSAVQQQASLQQPSNSNMQIKLLGGRPAPLLRRSSFPVHIGATTSERTQTPSGVATPAKSLSRRTSIDGSEEDSSPDVAKRRVRFLRRH
ncbi:hypothetical protein L9F63_004209 [Diploptera punctata]|uniref:Uncharacterized protein n=1 Tax=Diploptera punctata TaxID=6984 RepID=A0AAD8E7W3_DIPPU|nr:hypothetical protein L9F63_004209 [Diploptera punctata]